MSDSEEELEMFDRWNQQKQLVLNVVTSAINGDVLYNDFSEENQQYVDPRTGLRNVDVCLRVQPSLFKVITNFKVDEFEELCALVCPVLQQAVRTTGELGPGISGRKPKLSPQQRVLSCLIYLKHDNTVVYNAFQWNWSKSSLSDDALFVCTVINQVCSEEIRWPTSEERVALGRRISTFPGCIGFIDGTLCKIRRPYQDENQRAFFNGRKKMYCLNSTVIVDHDGLFIYVDSGYPGSYHDINILRQSDLMMDWRSYFLSTDEEQQYVLGDPGYLGADMFIMRRIADQEIPEGADADAVRAYNKMHAGRRIKVEWGIGGLKRKFRQFLTIFGNTRSRFDHMFLTGCILTNFLQRRRQIQGFDDLGAYEVEDNFGWTEEL